MGTFVWTFWCWLFVHLRAGHSAYSDDAHLDTDQIIRKYKYPVENHYVTTEDGYILHMHRIPNPGKKPFLLQHGFLDSSVTFLLMKPDKALGYYLFDLGYDVWLGNYRGNRYSRNHSRFDPDKDEKFWDFSWHEMGIYDLPAMIDYILNQTKYDKLLYVGHSQGTTGFFVMCSERPEYNTKIELMHALAPIGYMKHMQTPLKDFFTNMLKLQLSYQFREFLPKSDLFAEYCLQSSQTKLFCLEMFFLLLGKDMDQFDMSMYPTIVGHIPAGASTDQARHYFQLYESGKFRPFDYGPAKNQEKYGKSEPPSYPVKKCVAPVVLHYSRNDYLAEPIDVERLAKELGNVVVKNTNFPSNWNHMDYIWAKDVRKLLYNRLVKITKRFDKSG